MEILVMYLMYKMKCLRNAKEREKELLAEIEKLKEPGMLAD